MKGGHTLTSLVEGGASAQDLAAYLDRLAHHDRVRQCLEFPGRLQPKLYQTVKGQQSLDIETFVPVPERTTVYELRNSLPVWNISQKRFFRPSEGETIGYNHTEAWIARVAGPGYFFVMNGGGGELVFDYTRPVTLRPSGWPPLRANTGLIPAAVYGEMVDYVWMVCRHTVIGEAYRHGRSRNSWFLLTRAASES